jgi:hypothetical protein
MRRGTQVGRERSAKPSFVGSIPTRASIISPRFPAILLGNTEQIVIKHYSAWIEARQVGLDEAIKKANGFHDIKPVQLGISIVNRLSCLRHPEGQTAKGTRPSAYSRFLEFTVSPDTMNTLQATGSHSIEEVLLRLLETQEEHDRWLLERREAINSKISRGIGQLNRGEGIPEDQLDARLAKLKSQT